MGTPHGRSTAGLDWLTGRLPAAVAVAALLLGVVDLASGLTPEETSRLRAVTEVVPLQVAHAASGAVVVAGILLLLLAHGLRRRKRRAWVAAVLVLAASAALNLVKGLDVEEAVADAVLLGVLLARSGEFYAAADPASRWRAPAFALGMTAVSVGCGLLLLTIRSNDLVGHPSLAAQTQAVLAGLVGLTGPIRFRGHAPADLAGDVFGALGALVAVGSAYLALRPARPPARLAPHEEQRVRKLLARHGFRDSLGYFALRRDRAVVFSPTGKAAVSYRVVSGVMLAAGDPIGHPEAWPGAIHAFLAEARRHAWVPAVIGCSGCAAWVWLHEAGLHALELGDEAVVDTGDFRLQGRAMRNVRQMATRAARAGYSVSVRRFAELDPEEVATIRRQAAAWRGAEVERGFSMALGRFGDPADGDCVIATAHREGRLAAVQHFVPWGRDGLSLDLMRRDRAADPGLNELLIVGVLQAAPQLGVRRVSLNFAAFRSALERGGRPGAGPLLRTWRRLLLIASRWFQIESLYRFNAKFCPMWAPRYLCYPTVPALPRVALAALQAEALLVGPARWLAARRAAGERLGLATPGWVDRWVAPAYLGAAALLLPWIVYLGAALPDRTTSAHWGVAWVGFDVMEAAALALTGWCALRRFAWLEGAASATATLLVVDAWFDVTTATGSERLLAILLAVLVELPTAALSLWIAHRTEQQLER